MKMGRNAVWSAMIGASAVALSPSAMGGSQGLPRCATYEIDPEQSSMHVELFTGASTSPLHGRLTLGLGDPIVPMIPQVVNVSIGANELIAAAWSPPVISFEDPYLFQMQPAVIPAGIWVPMTGDLSLTVNLASPDFSLPVPMPVTLVGTLSNGQLVLSGDNGNVADGRVELTIVAEEIDCRPEIFYSTEFGFTSSNPSDPGGVSGGDLLSQQRCVIARNNDLTIDLGFKPVAPDVGLDALTQTNGPILFSTEVDEFSVAHGVIGHGDLVSAEGFVVRRNAELIDAFGPPAGTGDVGLDAAHLGFVFTALTNGGLFFSTEEDFLSQTNTTVIRHGDVLHEDGWVFRTNQDLMGAFNPVCAGPCPDDFGLDALHVFESGEIWFSTEIGFFDSNLGFVDDGAVLSSEGHRVVGNLGLLFGKCQPIEDLGNFGLDALDVETCERCHIPCPADLDGDGSVGASDLAILLGLWQMIGTNADLDMNGIVGAGDLAILLGLWGPCPS